MGSLSILRHLGKDKRASSAAEFALVLPLLLLFLFGIIDVGRLMWEWNKAEKATQAGVRVAVVTDLVPSALTAYKFTGVTQGAPVPTSEFPGVYCTGTSSAATCTCKATCAFATTAQSAAFNRIVTRMSQIDPRISHANVRIDYDNSGIGFAGNPYGPDVSPLVTVRLTGMTFQPTLLQLFGASVAMPGFPATMTLEDGQGTSWN